MKLYIRTSGPLAYVTPKDRTAREFLELAYPTALRGEGGTTALKLNQAQRFAKYMGDKGCEVEWEKGE